LAFISLLRQKFFWVITFSILGISTIQYLFSESVQLQEIDRELYYFPIFVAAMRYGMKGAMIALSAIYVLYIPFVVMTWYLASGHETARVIDLFFYFIFAFGAGYMADREKRIRAELEKNRLTISLGRITSGIVHDLKNPLISITGLLQRLAQGKGDCKKYVPVMLEDALRMKRIVYGVLDFARPISLHKEVCNLADVVKNAVKLCETKATEAKVSVKTELADIKAEADSYLLERALVNVISNAIEASSAGKEVLVRLAAQNGSAVISVRDHGPGMDSKTLSHCFEPYFSKKASGNGLGLPITKKIVEAHGGSVDIEQPPTGGTIFRITVPISC